jgi:phospholipid transport system transporter-binding protein
MIERNAERLLLKGAITFDDAREWREAVLKELDRDGLVIDLAGIAEADSTALSLMLEWQREAKARGFGITFAHLPAAIVSLAEAYGISSLIPTLDSPTAPAAH